MSEEIKPMYVLLRDYIADNKITSKEFAAMSGYSEAAVSEYITGKTAKDSKLNFVASLYLELKASQRGEIVVAERVKYENKIKEQEREILEYQAEIRALNKFIELIQKRSTEVDDNKKAANNS